MDSAKLELFGSTWPGKDPIFFWFSIGPQQQVRYVTCEWSSRVGFVLVFDRMNFRVLCLKKRIF